jgi:hypothetical protein
MKPFKIVYFVIFGFVTACSVLTLHPSDFAWPVESVLKVDDNGKVTDDRYSFNFNTKGLFYEEFGDSLAYLDRSLRIIRNSDGFYFITSEKFQNVYVFEVEGGAMELSDQIFISEAGMENPALNQRSPYIELIDGDKSLYLSNTGIEKDKK